jgi:hypothetical protein
MGLMSGYGRSRHKTVSAIRSLSEGKRTWRGYAKFDADDPSATSASLISKLERRQIASCQIVASHSEVCFPTAVMAITIVQGTVRRSAASRTCPTSKN